MSYLPRDRKASCVWRDPLQKPLSDYSQCNQNPEGCGQCANARRRCPGYRKLEDVIFKDESDKVVRKFQARESRSSQKLAFPAKSAVSFEGSSPDQDDGMEFVLSDTTTLPLDRKSTRLNSGHPSISRMPSSA